MSEKLQQEVVLLPRLYEAKVIIVA